MQQPLNWRNLGWILPGPTSPVLGNLEFHDMVLNKSHCEISENFLFWELGWAFVCSHRHPSLPGNGFGSSIFICAAWLAPGLLGTALLAVFIASVPEPLTSEGQKMFSNSTREEMVRMSGPRCGDRHPFSSSENTAAISQKTLEIPGRRFYYRNTVNASTIKTEGNHFLWASEREETLCVPSLHREWQEQYFRMLW